MKRKTAKLLVGIILASSLILLAISMAKSNGASQAVIWTDKPDYHPEETVTIFGAGFLPNAPITVNVTRPDSTVNTWTVTSGSDGSFTTTYLLDGITGNYTVIATDGTNTANTTFTDGTENFYGYNRDSLTDPVPGNWTKGNLGGNYVEGDFVSYQLFIDNASKVWGSTVFSISFDFHQDNTNAIYVDGFDTSNSTGFQYSSTGQLLPDGTPTPPPGWGVHIPTPEAGEAPGSGATITAYVDQWPPSFSESANPTGATVADERAFNVTGIPWGTFSSGNMTLFFRAHLALDIIWRNGLEKDLPTVLDGDEFQAWTNTFHGSSFATGSSRHFFLQFPGIGQKDIPIPIATYPITLINGHKYVDGVLFNGWNITLNGNLTLGSGLPPIPYNPPSVLTGTGSFINGSAWPTGYYEFTGLVSGTYRVTEENRSGYMHQNVVATGNGTNVITNVPFGYAQFDLAGGGTETVDFYNTFARLSITLTKTPSAVKVENGTLVTYTYNVTNTGNVPLTVNLTDSVFGTIYTGKVIAAGASNVTTFSVILTTTTTNVATAVGQGATGTVSATASATVMVLHPSISLTKTPSSTKVENGASVTYTFNVTNTGDTALTVTLQDSMFGTIFSGKNLAPGQSNITVITTTLTTTTFNNATATGVDQLTTSVKAQAQATVTVLHPSISLTKTPSSTKVENGASVTYTYNVTNTGDTSLTGNVSDNTFGFIGSFVLSAGQWTTFTKTVTLTVNTTNTATAIGVDQLSTAVTAQATATVTVLHPSISLTKTPSSTKVETGASVTYTFNVTNTGDTSLTVTLSDTKFGTIFSGLVLAPGVSNITTITTTLTTNTTNTATATGVDQLSTSVTATATAFVHVIHPSISVTKTPSLSKIETGGSVTYTYNVTNTGDTALTGNVSDNMFGTIGSFVLPAGSWVTFTKTVTLTQNTTNTVTATGEDQLGTLVSATASAFVHVIHPSISLSKTPSSAKIETGTSVTYTYNVTNTGDTTLLVSLTDNVFGSIFNGKVLAPGESNITMITVTLTQNTTNTATATGMDQLEHTVTASATAFVHVIHPSISLTKTPSSPKIETGSSVTYTYNVTNTGDTALTGNVSDSEFGAIGSFVLPAGSWVTFTKTVTLTQNTTNTATATGEDQLGTIVSAQATAFVHVIHPSISLTKTPSSTKVENGATVTYTYNVTNTGDTTLLVSLSDNEFGTIFTNKVLAPGAFNVTVISETLTQNTTNTATATGFDQFETQVTAQASATVTVLHPSLILTKTPSSNKVLSGTSVTYTYNVTNNGDTTITAINVTDDTFGVIGSVAVLAPSQWQTFTFTAVLTTNTTNTAMAVGVDQLGTQASARASATVVVIHPSISVVKTCSPEDQLAPGNVTWTVVVTNTGDVTLTAINVTDTRHGVLGAGLTLAPGQNVTYTVLETLLPPGTYYDNATAFGAHQLGVVSAWDDANCTVRAVFILKQFTAVTVLPEGISEGFSATLVNSTNVNVTGLNSGPKIYFTVQYYFENSLNFLGSSFDGQAHNFTLWDKWGGNLMALGSPPASFNQITNNLTLVDGHWFIIDPTLTDSHSYRGYIGSGLDISNLASQGQAWITMHLGDQQNSTNPGKGKGTKNDGSSYDTDTVWYIGELGVNESATLTLYIAPGKNPGGKLQFSSPGCTVINTGPRVRAYGNTYNNADFLYAVERTNTLTVCVSPKPASTTLSSPQVKTVSTNERLLVWSGLFMFALLPAFHKGYNKNRKFRWLSQRHV